MRHKSNEPNKPDSPTGSDIVECTLAAETDGVTAASATAASATTASSTAASATTASPHATTTTDSATDSGIIITRRDGWTPFARRLFLEVLSETGRVTVACEYCRMSKQSAYALRNRDPVFAASWDAACDLARAPLADALYERALEGVTETITRNGVIVAERHRHDSRLSIAVLHRLDKRCDRADELGSNHRALAAHWDEWMALVGSGADADAKALLENASHGQLGQLLLGRNPTADDDDEGDDDGADDDEQPRFIDMSEHCWRDSIDRDVWVTNFPPPRDFTGFQEGEWGDDGYERDCTAEEIAILEADEAAGRASELAEQEELRDTLFAILAGEYDDEEDGEDDDGNGDDDDENGDDDDEDDENAGDDDADEDDENAGDQDPDDDAE
ncbi:MAG: hypothetical protein V4444_07825 [Pseudomonadota bacterium]